MRTIRWGHRAAATVALSSAVLLGGAIAVPATASPPASPGNTGAHKVLYPTVAAAHSHAAAVRALNTAPSLLTFGGGVDGIGVTTGPPKVVLVFWGSQWGTPSVVNGYTHFTGDPQGMAPQLQAMLQGLGTGGEMWSGVMTQYCEGVSIGATSGPANAAHVGFPSGGNLVGLWQDASSPAPSNASGVQLAQEAISAAEHFNFPSNRDIQYVIASPTGTHPDGFNAPLQWCAWHDWNGDWGVGSPVGDIAFTNLPYLTDVGASCGQNFVNGGSAGTLDGVTIVEGHEYAETITDQNPAGGWTDSSGAETGDKCAWITPGQPGGAANVGMGTGSFPMQSTWANDGGTCEISHPIVGVQTPDFTLGVSPSSRSINQNSPTTYTVTVAPLNGFNASVSLSLGGLPSGASGTFTPGSISSGSGPSTLSVNSGTAAPGTYSLTITGTGGGITHTANASLTITPPTPVLHISVANAYAQSATNRYWNAWADVTIVDQNGTPVAGVTVTFTFSGGAGATRTCVTNSSGFCSTSSNKVRVTTSHHSETVTLTKVSKSGDTWDGVTVTRTATH